MLKITERELRANVAECFVDGKTTGDERTYYYFAWLRRDLAYRVFAEGRGLSQGAFLLACLLENEYPSFMAGGRFFGKDYLRKLEYAAKVEKQGLPVDKSVKTVDNLLISRL